MVWRDPNDGLYHDVASSDSQVWWVIVCRTDESRGMKMPQTIVHSAGVRFGVVTCLKCLTHVTR